MSANQSDQVRKCSQCGQQLKKQKCLACDGKGRIGFVRKKVCQNCQGEGYTYQCPNTLKHIAKDYGFRNTPDPKDIFGQFGRGRPFTAPKTFDLFKDSKIPKIPPPWKSNYPNPWHPSHPNNPFNRPFNANSPGRLSGDPNSNLKKPFGGGRLPGDPTIYPPPPDLDFPSDKTDKDT